MKGKDFLNKINKDPRFVFMGGRYGDTPSGDHVVVCTKTLNIFTRFDVIAILEKSWKELETAMTGMVDVRDENHVKRLAGFYETNFWLCQPELEKMLDRELGDLQTSEAQSELEAMRRKAEKLGASSEQDDAPKSKKAKAKRKSKKVKA